MIRATSFASCLACSTRASHCSRVRFTSGLSTSSARASVAHGVAAIRVRVSAAAILQIISKISRRCPANQGGDAENWTKALDYFVLILTLCAPTDHLDHTHR